MNKKLLSVIIGIVLLISLALIYVTTSKQDDSKTDISATPEKSISEKEEVATVQPVLTSNRDGAYIQYSDTVISETPGTKVLFFHAPWCPQCRAIEESIKKDGVPNGVIVIKVDYDSNQALRQKYAVMLQTTFVKVDDAGNKIASYVAYEEPQFSSVERELLR